jgi:spore maturation protein CgeB
MAQFKHMTVMTIRVLFAGENWHGSNSTSCKRALRALGCDVLDLDDFHYLPEWESTSLRIVRRLLRKRLADEYSRMLVKRITEFEPQLVFVFKGAMVRRSVLEHAHQMQALAFNFYPDWNFYDSYRRFGHEYSDCIPAYDCIFTPKSYHFEIYQRYAAKRVEFLPYAYDPWCHFPLDLTDQERVTFASDVAFIGTWGKARAEFLEELVRRGFPYELAIWGNQWDKLAANSPLRRFVKFKPANGSTQAKVFAGTKIALAFVTSPDLHTARTFEIPAFGAFMLAERTTEHVAFFEEGKEIACFASVAELRSKIDYYLTHDSERMAIAKAGFKRVTQKGNSYVDRMRRVLEIYAESKNQATPVSGMQQQ